MITLDQTKQHLRVLHTREDTLIQGYVDAALCEFESYTNRKLYPDQPALTTDTSAPQYTAILDQKIIAGCLLLVGYLYNNRDMDAAMPRAIQNLWASYRVLQIA
ncbi:MAG: head-tail connector protein [Bermanella sp.]